MDFDIPEEIQATLDALDAFIEQEIAPLQAQDDNERFFDHRREWARTDFEHDGVPRADWEELLREMRRRADAAGWLRLALPAELGGRDASNLEMAIIREHLAHKGLGLHNDLQNESSIVGNFPTVLMMRENEERMKFLGYNTNISRLILFTFTGAVAGLAGAFYTLHFQFCSQSAISVDMTTTVLLMTFVGGTGTFWGPMLGVLVYVILQNYLSDITDRWPLFMGLIFVFMVLFIPGGLTQIIQSIKTLFAGKRGTGKPIAVKEVST